MAKIYYETTNLNLAVFLLVKGKQIVGINPRKGGIKEFTFIRTDSLKELDWLFRCGDKDDERLLVSVHEHNRARQELLDKLNN